jgi:signal transduction histidine kinase
LLRELETVNAELTQHAAKIRELSVSEERARMAREIHDSVGHHLTVINLQLQNARRFRERKPDEAWEEVEGARELALEALSEVRRSVRALKPLAVEGKSGVGALSALADNFGGTGIEVSFETEGRGRELSGEAELVLYRAMQEGLTNAARHSGSRRVSATLCFEREGGVRLVVADDGRGADGAASEGGFGLSALKERVEALGGTLLWGDRPGGGFALEAKLPEVSRPAGTPATTPAARP